MRITQVYQHDSSNVSRIHVGSWSKLCMVKQDTEFGAGSQLYSDAAKESITSSHSFE